MTNIDLVTPLSDQDLLAAVKAAATHARDATVRLIARLAQVDARRLCLGEGCASLFTFCRQLRRAQDLLRHAIPTGDVATIIDRALMLLLADVEKTTLARADGLRTAGPLAPGSRHIPAAVRREVWKRDGGQCAFVGPHGRCGERAFLEFHPSTRFALWRGPP